MSKISSFWSTQFWQIFVPNQRCSNRNFGWKWLIPANWTIWKIFFPVPSYSRGIWNFPGEFLIPRTFPFFRFSLVFRKIWAYWNQFLRFFFGIPKKSFPLPGNLGNNISSEEWKWDFLGIFHSSHIFVLNQSEELKINANGGIPYT